MAKDKKDVKPVVPEEVTKLAGTFFDTFSFPDKTEEELANEKAEADKIEADKIAAEKNKGKTEEEIAAEEKAEEERVAKEKKDKEGDPTPEELEAEKVKMQEELQTAVDLLKEKKEDELDDEEKQFLKDFEAGELKDYVAPKTEEPPESTGYDTLTKDLIASGVLVEPEEIADSVESFNSAITKTVESKFNEWVDEIPEDYRNILDHLRAGGSANTYLQNKQEIDYTNLDYTNENIQTTLVREDLRQQGHTDEEIDEKMTDLKDLEKMEKEAKRAGKKFETQQTQRIKEYDQSIADALTAQDVKDQAEVDELAKAIDDTNDIAGFKLTDKRRKAFKKYLFDVDAEGETAASKASNTIEDRLKMMFMTFINYDFTDLQKSVTTQKTRDLSKFLTRFKDSQTASKGIVVKEEPPEPETQKLHIPSIFDRPNVED